MTKNLIVLVCILVLVGCRDSQHESGSHDHPHGEKSHAHEGEAHEHNQPPPHGGSVVEIANHKFNLELVQDSEAGKLQAYVLDGHMEYVAVPEKSFELVATMDGKEEKLFLERVATGGDSVPETSSLFEGTAEWLKSTQKFEGFIPQIALKGKTFTNISFSFPNIPTKGR